MRRWRPILILALALGALSPFASSLPDGLERVAERLGFAARQAEPVAPAPLPDYALPGHEESRPAGALVGIAGTLLVFGLAYTGARLLARKGGGGLP
ncbi:MAG: PDGLE domain-containing protein [Armatimonadetes bacterium]|nr:PDGLE domain-containing protein [Armatimonadota bacterium]